MNASVAKAAFPLVAALLLGVSSAAIAQQGPVPSPQGAAPGAPVPLGAPMRLVPVQPEAAAPAAQAPARSPQGLEVETLGALSADAGGTLEPGAGGLPADAWSGTPRPLAEALIQALPVEMPSAAMRDLSRRLLLSRVQSPAGPAGPRGLVGLRLEKLAAMGDAEGATAFTAAVPAALDDERAAEAWVATQLLAGDPAAACAQVPTFLKSFGHPVWQKYQVACAIQSGNGAEATLGIDLLREQGEKDEDFFLLAESAAAGRTAPVKGIARPTPPQMAVIALSKRGLPAETQLTDPAALVAVALSNNQPIALRLSAAERAASLGLLTPPQLAAVYQSVSIADNELKDPLPALAKREGTQARALAVQALKTESSPGTKAELLRAAVAAGTVPLLSGTYGAILIQEMGLLPPGTAYAFVAPAAARLALLQGRPDLARPWVDIARADMAAGNVDAAPFHRLWPLAAINGLARPGDVDLNDWLDTLGVDTDPDMRARAGDVLSLLAATAVPVDPVARLRAIAPDRPVQPVALPDPTLWYRLVDAGGSRKTGEAAALSLALLGAAGPAGSPALFTTHAVLHLTDAGLQTEARRLATEAAAHLLTP